MKLKPRSSTSNHSPNIIGPLLGLKMEEGSNEAWKSTACSWHCLVEPVISWAWTHSAQPKLGGLVALIHHPLYKAQSISQESILYSAHTRYILQSTYQFPQPLHNMCVKIIVTCSLCGLQITSYYSECGDPGCKTIVTTTKREPCDQCRAAGFAL